MKRYLYPTETGYTTRMARQPHSDAIATVEITQCRTAMIMYSLDEKQGIWMEIDPELVFTGQGPTYIKTLGDRFMRMIG